jgi:cytochrome c biogenesis protein CcdA
MEKHIIDGLTLVGVGLTAMGLGQINQGIAHWVLLGAGLILIVMGVIEFFSK